MRAGYFVNLDAAVVYGVGQGFWINDTQEGSLSFSWSDPLTDETVNFRFVTPPTWTLEVGGTTASRLWRAHLHLEVLP